MKTKVKLITQWIDQHKTMIVAIAVVLPMALVPTAAIFAEDSSLPLPSFDFSGALALVFAYASQIFTWLIPIAAIGIGFRFGGNLLAWVGDMLSSAMHFRS